MNFTFKHIGSSLRDRKVIDFLTDWHYCDSAKGLQTKYVFGLYDGSRMIGLSVIGLPFGVKYNKENIVEIRRFCCIDNTPKNTESYFLGHILRWLKNNTFHETVISFADPYHGHSGIIYRAANFKYIGEQKHKSVMFEYNGKLYHQRAYANKGKVGDAVRAKKTKRVIMPKKHIYTYELRR